MLSDDQDSTVLPTSEQAVAADLREAERSPFVKPGQVICEIIHNGRGRSKVLMICRDLSATGLRVAHLHYIQPGSEVLCTLIGPTRQGLRIRGRIVWCDYLRNHLHEAGIAFDTPIDVSAAGLDAMLDQGAGFVI